MCVCVKLNIKRKGCVYTATVDWTWELWSSELYCWSLIALLPCTKHSRLALPEKKNSKSFITLQNGIDFFFFFAISWCPAVLTAVLCPQKGSLGLLHATGSGVCPPTWWEGGGPLQERSLYAPSLTGMQEHFCLVQSKVQQGQLYCLVSPSAALLVALGSSLWERTVLTSPSYWRQWTIPTSGHTAGYSEAEMDSVDTLDKICTNRVEAGLVLVHLLSGWGCFSSSVEMGRRQTRINPGWQGKKFQTYCHKESSGAWNKKHSREKVAAVVKKINDCVRYFCGQAEALSSWCVATFHGASVAPYVFL